MYTIGPQSSRACGLKRLRSAPTKYRPFSSRALRKYPYPVVFRYTTRDVRSLSSDTQEEELYECEEGWHKDHGDTGNRQWESTMEGGDSTAKENTYRSSPFLKSHREKKTLLREHWTRGRKCKLSAGAPHCSIALRLIEPCPCPRRGDGSSDP